jgi:DNA-binding NtrC family response regulator
MGIKSRILIIDDEPRWIEFAKGALEGFSIEVAPDLETALAKLEDNRYDLIIASSRRLHVLEVIARQYPDKRAVVTTVRPTTREAINASRLGALDYFAKSFLSGDVADKVDEVISKPTNVPHLAN